MSRNIYQDIALRTQGDIYVGVVGPVRTGKSTFIKKFMETLVLPHMENPYKRDRAMDELPQSAAGRTIMTTEPKFIPNEAVEVDLGDHVSLRVRLIDCVGYIVPNALGYIENDVPRMVHTPWFEKEIPFNMAAEIGTQKVIGEHSTIGLVVTTDGSIGELERADYEEAEARVVRELQQIRKPFIVLLNSIAPESEEVRALAASMEERYGVPVLPVDCLNVDERAIKRILEMILFEFPLKEVRVALPKWLAFLPKDHWLRTSVFGSLTESGHQIEKIREIKMLIQALHDNEYVKTAEVSEIRLGEGSVTVTAEIPHDLFYRVLGETTGVDVADDGDLIAVISTLASTKKAYDKIAFALHEAEERGYGIVTPTLEDLSLEEPEIVKQGGRFGVKLKASAPSFHIMRADIQTEVAPIVGTEKQSEDLVRYLLTEFEDDPKKIWESNLFGKSLHELVNEGLHTKLTRMPEDARDKMRETLQRVINEGSGGLICIIL